MLFKYRKHFGIFRIFLGILLALTAGYYYFQQTGPVSEEKMTILFVLIFFLMYSYSAIRNGISEFNENMPAFNLLRFFEAAMNGFLGLYLLILVFTMNVNIPVRMVILLLDILIIISMVRDLRIISIQYYDRKRKESKK